MGREFAGVNYKNQFVGMVIDRYVWCDCVRNNDVAQRKGKLVVVYRGSNLCVGDFEIRSICKLIVYWNYVDVFRRS